MTRCFVVRFSSGRRARRRRSPAPGRHRHRSSSGSPSRRSPLKRDERVGERHRGRPGALDGDEAGSHDHRPSEVQRRHRGELIRHRLVRVLVLYTLSPCSRSVSTNPSDRSILGGASGNANVNGERHERDADQPRPDRAVDVTMADEQSHQECKRDREVHPRGSSGRVKIHHRLLAKRQLLHGSLGEHVELALEVDDAAGIRERLGRLVPSDAAHLAIPEVHAHDGPRLRTGDSAAWSTGPSSTCAPHWHSLALGSDTRSGADKPGVDGQRRPGAQSQARHVGGRSVG